MQNPRAKGAGILFLKQHETLNFICKIFKKIGARNNAN